MPNEIYQMYCEAFFIGVVTKKVEAYLEYIYVVQQTKYSSTAIGDHEIDV